MFSAFTHRLRRRFASRRAPAEQPPTSPDVAGPETETGMESETGTETGDYADRMAQEIGIYQDQINVHDLPAIHHYWADRYLRPVLESFGYAHPDDFFEKELAKQYDLTDRRPDDPLRVVSVGSGNGDTEVRVAAGLAASGRPHFVIECIDVNPDMLERSAQAAAERGLHTQIRPLRADFNRWVPEGPYDVVMANQSLHHVVELEHLFASITQAIGATGVFVTSDMIGRNGHMRWPEALAIVQEYWAELPDSYRYNLQLKRQEDEYGNWDCSAEGFEGIRAQDILGLLVERFGFRTFIAFGNIIDPFIDRGFGHHFDAESERDRNFIDRVHARDEAELLAGNVKPTHMLAVMVGDRDVEPRVWKNLSPEFCVRHAG